MAYRITVVDDDRSVLKSAERILTANNYEVDCLSSGEELLDYVKTVRPDLILLDLHMEGIDGFETIRRLKAARDTRDLPVIFLTADTDADSEVKALLEGAMDFVLKPFVASVLLMRARNTIELVRLQTDLKSEVKRMTSEMMKEHEKNERLSMQIVKTLAGTIDAKDSYTNGHSNRVAEYSRMIAARAGYSEQAQEEIYMMGLLHDVGKIGIPDAVINKPTKLTDEEFDIIKTHPMKGFDILKNITEMPKLAVGARWHHERFDGTGYPDGLSGYNIPEEARIIAVADAYDAMSSRRSYHGIFGQAYIARELERCKGTQFDERFAEIMLGILREDTEYKLCEHTEDKRPEGQELTEDEKKDKMFGFLAMVEVGGLDTAIGMKYCMNDTGFYAEMLSDFAAGADERELGLERSLAQHNLEKYRVYVHSLKSASKTIGAQRLSDKARELEEAAKNGDAEFVTENHPDLIADLHGIVGGILMAMSMYDIG